MSTPITPEHYQAARDKYHAALQGLLISGALAGAGGMGLYHLMKRTKKKVDALMPQKPDYEAIATAPFLPAPVEQPKIASDVKKAAFDADLAAAIGMPLAGAGAGALLNAAMAEKGQKRRAAIVGALGGGGLGLAGSLLGTRHGGRVLGAPFEYMAREQDPSTSKPADPLPEGPGMGFEGLHWATRTLAPVAGALGGGYLTHQLLKGDREKQRENVDQIQQARDEYFRTLVGDEKTSSALAKAFEKRSNWAEGDWYPSWGATPENPHASSVPGSDAVGNLGSLAVGLLTLGTLGAAGVGGTYMYNRTKAKSEAKQLARARVARERLQNVPGPWIDPREIAQIKSLATTGG